MAIKPRREKGKRWGKKRVDLRNWRTYNEELVVRGEFLLDFDWVFSWDEELKKMNQNKRGRPFDFPESLIELQAVWNQMVGVRGVEGITRKLVEVAKLPKFNDFSTINRRIRNINCTIQLRNQKHISVSADGSGMKMHNAGEYRKMKYKGKKKKWLKVTISANPLTKDLLAVDVEVEGKADSEPEIAMRHMKKIWSSGRTIDKFWGDGSFDVKELYQLLETHKTESAIPPRDNASENARGSMRRAREVLEYKSKSWDEWAANKEYGKRWLGTEGVFSAVKGIFGENTRAKTAKNACLEAERKFWAYEKIRRYAQAKT